MWLASQHRVERSLEYYRDHPEASHCLDVHYSVFETPLTDRSPGPHARSGYISRITHSLTQNQYSRDTIETSYSNNADP